MEAIKLLLGFYQHGGVMHGKPIGLKTSNSDMVMVDKTAFIVDKAWDGYLKNNNINGVMFKSSIKMLGDAYADRIIDMRGFDSIETLMGSVNRGKEVRFDLKDFAFGQFVNDNHHATVALQVGAGLNR